MYVYISNLHFPTVFVFESDKFNLGPLEKVIAWFSLHYFIQFWGLSVLHILNLSLVLDTWILREFLK